MKLKINKRGCGLLKGIYEEYECGCRKLTPYIYQVVKVG